MVTVLALLLAFAARVEVVNQSFEIPANDWRYVPRPVNPEPALVTCDFQSAPGARIKVALLTQADLDARRAGREYEEIAASPTGPRGFIRVAVHEPDAYLVVENRAPKPATVRLRIFLEEPQVRYLSRGRQFAVILISFGVFFALVSFSAVKLLRAFRK